MTLSVFSTHQHLPKCIIGVSDQTLPHSAALTVQLYDRLAYLHPFRVPSINESPSLPSLHLSAFLSIHTVSTCKNNWLHNANVHAETWVLAVSNVMRWSSVMTHHHHISTYLCISMSDFGHTQSGHCSVLPTEIHSRKNIKSGWIHNHACSILLLFLRHRTHNSGASSSAFTMPPRRNIRDEDWERLRPIIRKLYLEEDRSLKDVLLILGTFHSFSPR